MRIESMQKYNDAARNGAQSEHIGAEVDNLASVERIIEYFPTAAVITNSAGFPVIYNQAAVGILGKISGNLNPEAWPTQFGLYQDDGKTYYQGNNFPLARALRGETIEPEVILVKPENAMAAKWISMSAKALISDDGKITGAILSFSDITANKQIEVSHERKIRRVEAAYAFQQQITEIGNDPLKILNKVVSFAAQNIGDACIAALLNIPADKLRVIAFQHVRPEARELLYSSITLQEFGLQTAIEGVIHTGESLLVPIVDQERLRKQTQPDQLRYFNEIGLYSLLVVPIKGRKRILGLLTLLKDRGSSSYTVEDQIYIMDIAYRTGLAIDNNYLLNLLRVESSERRNAEEALELSEARFRSIFTATPLGIKLLDLDGNLIETNPAFQQMMGYSDDELRGNPISKFMHPMDAERLLQLLDKLKNDGIQSFQSEHRFLSKDGSTLWINGTFTGIKKNKQDKPLAFVVAISENITERKRIDAEITKMKSRLQSHVELERLRLAQELHDGPLQDLYSAIYKIENWGNQDDPQNQVKIETLKQDLLNVIQSLRTTAKDLRPPALASFGLEKAIRSHAEEFSENHPELTIHLNLAQDGQNLPEDLRLILFRIYQHSLANIFRHAQASEVYVSFTYDAEDARLEIHDNGVGFVVPTYWVDLVRQGHFGLAGAVERASLLDGKFSVESTPGEGTTVCVVIPIPFSNDRTSDESSED